MPRWCPLHHEDWRHRSIKADFLGLSKGEWVLKKCWWGIVGSSMNKMCKHDRNSSSKSDRTTVISSIVWRGHKQLSLKYWSFIWQQEANKTSSSYWWVPERRDEKHASRVVFGDRLNISSASLLYVDSSWDGRYPNRSYEARNSAGLAGTESPPRTGLDTPAQTLCGQTALEGHLEFHSTFCLSLRLRKLGLMRLDTQGLPLWKSHWKTRKLVTEMTKMSWLKGSMATRLCCREIAVSHAYVTGKTSNLWRDKCMKIVSVCLWPNPQKTQKCLLLSYRVVCICFHSF